MSDSTQHTNGIRQAAEKYAEIRAAREVLEAQAKEMKAQEDELKAQLIMEMNTQGMPSVRLEGLGRFVVKMNTRYDIKDIDLVARQMMQRMVDNAKTGRPWGDGLLLQKRTAKGVIDELIESGELDETQLASVGLAKTEVSDLTFTRQKD